MVNKDNVQVWLDALRSGEYEQGKGALKNSQDEFCCLGVACDISGLSEWNYNSYLSESAFLPPQVAEWLGIEDDKTLIVNAPPGHRLEARASLIGLNDNGVPFVEIADAIERELFDE